MRREVWGKTNDPDMMKGQCFCCCREIRQDDFDCGHVIPAAKGGQTSL